MSGQGARIGGLGRAASRTSNISVETVRDDVGIRAARGRFGGLDWAAVLAGVLSSIGAIVIIGGLATAVGQIAYQLDDADTVSIGALIAGIAVIVVSFLVGGWIAGRVARYDGGRNGLATAAVFIVLAAVLAALGAWADDEYDVFGELELPQWFSDDSSTRAVISAIIAAALSLIAAWLGGMLGTRYHRRADQVISHTRAGAVAVPSIVTALPPDPVGDPLPPPPAPDQQLPDPEHRWTS